MIESMNDKVMELEASNNVLARYVAKQEVQIMDLINENEWCKEKIGKLYNWLLCVIMVLAIIGACTVMAVNT